MFLAGPWRQGFSLFMLGLLGMVDKMTMTVLLMDMLQVSTQLVLELTTVMAH